MIHKLPTASTQALLIRIQMNLIKIEENSQRKILKAVSTIHQQQLTELQD
jgi:hypothetical protein